MKKDTIIPKSNFDGLKEASDMFEPFDVLAFVTDPGYGYEDVKMLLIKFHRKPGKYDNPDGLGLCIYNVATHEFIEEPADLTEYNEGDLTEDKLYKRYRLKRDSYVPLDENITIIKKYDQFVNEYFFNDKIELVKKKLNYWNRKIKSLSGTEKYEKADEMLEEANKILNGFGVEPITDESAFVNKYYYDIIGLYVNMGDTYDTTLVFDTEKQKFLITSWGDFYEKWQSENPVSTNENLNWKPSKNEHISGYVKLSYPHKKTGDMVTGKTRETWINRLSKLFGEEVDLSNVKNFYDKGGVINFTFEHNGDKYSIIQNPVEKPSYSEFHLQKWNK